MTRDNKDALVHKEVFDDDQGTTYNGMMKQIIDDEGIEVWVKHGRGVQTWQNGNVYDGFWSEG